MDKKIIGRNIQQKRILRGMTQTELAKKAGVSTDHISHIEIGSGSISLSLLLELCNLLSLTPDDILLDEAGSFQKEVDASREEDDGMTGPHDSIYSDESGVINHMQYFLNGQPQNI